MKHYEFKEPDNSIKDQYTDSIMRIFDQSIYQDGLDSSQIFDILQTVLVHILAIHENPRKGLSFFIETLQELEEGPEFDEVAEYIKQCVIAQNKQNR